MSKKTGLTTPLKTEDILNLTIGDVVHLSGTIITARDMAHIRILQYLEEGKQLPEDFQGAAVFHAGPNVKNEEGEWNLSVIGPTTSMRMEPFSQDVLEKLGVKALIGKGGMGEGTQEALRKFCSVYLLSAPGCAAVQSNSVIKVIRVHWLDLGVPEAMWILKVEDWGPLIVAMDSKGNNLFKNVKERARSRIPALLEEGKEVHQ